MDKQVLIYEYEQILLHNKASFAPYYFKYGDNTSENYVLYIIKHAVEHYLRWTPEEMLNYFTKDIAKQIKVEPLIKYIDFPPELEKEKNYSYIAYAIYPKELKLNLKDLVLTTYKNVLDGTLCKFPKEYLSGTQGMMRACICLQYALNTNYAFHNNREIYQFFSQPTITKILKEYRLNNICNEIFESPLDYLHEALPHVQKDEYWYRYYRFKMLTKSDN